MAHVIATFTDFGAGGPYVGQLHAAILSAAPNTAVVHLMSDAPKQNPRAAAYLLAAYSRSLTADTVVVSVVDPGVGTTQRGPVALRAGKRWYVGPDNGLFDVVCAHQHVDEVWDIVWEPDALSSSFHGRDLFAPIAGWIASGRDMNAMLRRRTGLRGHALPPDLPEIIYVDVFGNAVSGVRASTLGPNAAVAVNGRALAGARTFGEVPPGQAFWYENSSGLVELAVNGGSAAEQLGVGIGTVLSIEPSAHHTRLD